MTRVLPGWAKHERVYWRRQAANVSLELADRVRAFCYAHHDVTGHTPLGRGELSRALADKRGVPAERKNLHNAIAKAVRSGWIASGSTVRCLIAPKGISGGLGERRDHECPGRTVVPQTTKPTAKRGPTDHGSVVPQTTVYAADVHERPSVLSLKPHLTAQTRTLTTLALLGGEGS